ncbi:MAG TPA: DUF3524 domain-containing protein [Candidatus Polarisedimenticolia bacterium]|nr:DUF3524 domain-containing protein [Candidatus Polarisedimenticolia bacterium]
MAHLLFLDPYAGPSHLALSEALRAHCRHQVTRLELSPRKWKWRMRGAALALEPRIRAIDPPPDVLAATDMLNLPELLALVRDRLPARTPVLLYFHENQLTYPVSCSDERDIHFALCNLYSALAADRVIFNSRFHLEEFMAAVPELLRKMPDERPSGIAERIRQRSAVLGVPVSVPALSSDALSGRPPWIAWNHRWEEDKDPAAFFRAARTLDRRGVEFGLVVAGQSFRDRPPCFEEARRDLAHRIVRWGPIESKQKYFATLARCRIAVSTARHEFYGLAVREAVGMGCYPLLPRRVVYPELAGGREQHLYGTEEELADRLEQVLADPEAAPSAELRAEALAASPEAVAAQWDAWIDELLSRM